MVIFKEKETKAEKVGSLREGSALMSTSEISSHICIFKLYVIYTFMPIFFLSSRFLFALTFFSFKRRY